LKTACNWSSMLSSYPQSNRLPHAQVPHPMMGRESFCVVCMFTLVLLPYNLNLSSRREDPRRELEGDLLSRKRGKFFGVVDARGTSQECPECGGEVRKDLSVRVHDCPSCGYTTDRDVAAGQNIRNRGIKLISTAGPAGKETACAVELPGVGVTQSRQVAQSRKGKTRKNQP